MISGPVNANLFMKIMISGPENANLFIKTIAHWKIVNHHRHWKIVNKILVAKWP